MKPILAVAFLCNLGVAIYDVHCGFPALASLAFGICAFIGINSICDARREQ